MRKTRPLGAAFFDAFEPLLVHLAISVGDRFKVPPDKALVIIRRAMRKMIPDDAELLARMSPDCRPTQEALFLDAAAQLRKISDDRI
jgi:hypothetical protein